MLLWFLGVYFPSHIYACDFIYSFCPQRDRPVNTAVLLRTFKSGTIIIAYNTTSDACS